MLRYNPFFAPILLYFKKRTVMPPHIVCGVFLDQICSKIISGFHGKEFCHTPSIIWEEHCGLLGSKTIWRITLTKLSKVFEDFFFGDVRAVFHYEFEAVATVVVFFEAAGSHFFHWRRRLVVGQITGTGYSCGGGHPLVLRRGHGCH